MAAYLFQVAYTPEAWAGLAQSPQDRTEAIKPAVEQLDGTVIAEWLSFGEYDVVSIIDLPDNVSAAALSIAEIVEMDRILVVAKLKNWME